jgi:O-antigen/teichoic acid export membrane protein
MTEIDIAIIKKKSLSGVLALTTRTFLLQIIAFASTFLLTVFLSPAVFGVFYVVSAIISFLTYFSDIGLAAALIQKKDEITESDLSTTFTIQQLLVVSIVILSLIFSRPVSAFYGLDEAGLWLFRALSLSFFLSSLKTIPTVLLERRLEFKLLVIPQIIETLAFYVTAVGMASQGFGITSFTWAVLARAITGLIAIYIVSPWRVTLGFSRNAAGRLLKFGLPFQTNSLLALVKDDLMTIFLGKILPFAEIGYIGWAKKWADVPLRLIVDSIVKVTFPAFSRLQHSGTLLGKAIEQTLFGLALTIFPISCGIIFFGGPMVSVIPRYEKWEPALLSLVFLSLAGAVSSLSVPLTNTLNAIGKIKITLILMIMWTTLTWILTLGALALFGFHGFAIANFILTATVVIVVLIVKRYADFSFVRAVSAPFAGAIVQAAWYAMSIPRLPGTPAIIVLNGITGVIIYGVFLWIFRKHRILKMAQSFRASI